MPPQNSYQPGGQQGGFDNQPQHGGYPGNQQHSGNYQGSQQQNNNQNEELEKLAMNFLPKLLKKLDGCCVVM